MMTGHRLRALEDIRILDFGISIAMPLATKYLSDNGATVIKVESKQKLDVSRAYTPMAGNRVGIDRCGWFDMYATGKYSIGLNLNDARGRALARKLAVWAGVLTDNFMPGTMEKWGLGYEDLRKLKPDIIMVEMSMFGKDGPAAGQSGFGTMMQASAGYASFVGWPDRPPIVSSIPYTDFIGCWHAIVAILGAIDYRERTGKGQYIDLSQYEAGVGFLSTALLDYTANGRIARPLGNRSPEAAPHGVYRCLGEDRGCAIAVCSELEWQAFCQVLGNPDWSKSSRFASIADRKENEDELNGMVESWTAARTAEDVMAILQQAGVPAGVMATGPDLDQDPQLRHRKHFKMLDHPEMGIHAYQDSSWRFSRTPAEISRSPLFAEHNEYVYKSILGLSQSEFETLLADGVLD